MLSNTNSQPAAAATSSHQNPVVKKSLKLVKKGVENQNEERKDFVFGFENSKLSTDEKQNENNQKICCNLYENAYLKGLYSDLIVRISLGSNSDGILFKLHRIIAIRSPYLAALIQDVEQSSNEYQSSITISIHSKDPYLTPRGLGVAFGHLYASYSAMLLDADSADERTTLLKSVLSASQLLQLPDLAQDCTDLLKNDISIDSVVHLAHFFLESSPNDPLVQDVKDAVFTFLCNEFFEKVMLSTNSPLWGTSSSTQTEAYQKSIEIFSRLPFEWIKAVLESEHLSVPSDLERFQFAKAVIELRKRKSDESGNDLLLAGNENVLLSFGGKTRHGVTIVRKVNPPAAQHQQHQKQNGNVRNNKGNQQHSRIVWTAQPNSVN